MARRWEAAAAVANGTAQRAVNVAAGGVARGEGAVPAGKERSGAGGMGGSACGVARQQPRPAVLRSPAAAVVAKAASGGGTGPAAQEDQCAGVGG